MERQSRLIHQLVYGPAEKKQRSAAACAARMKRIIENKRARAFADNPGLDTPANPDAALARLSVNLNKVALLRNSRRTGVPDVMHFAKLAHQAGADGITVHPRPDERHIRADDVRALARLMQPWRPAFELNIEGYPDERFLALVQEVQPEQCTLVPDAPDVFTSEEGWKLDDGQTRLIETR